MHLIWHGTASVEIVSGPDRILFDPFVTLPGAEIKTEIGEFDGFPEIFVTHGHFDHIASLPEIVRRNPEVRIYCTSVPLATLVRKGVDRNILRELAFGQEIRTGGFEILPMHGKHARLLRPDMGRLSYMLKSPARGNIPRILKDHLSCPERDQTVFYRIRAEGKTVCLMGSLNLREDASYPAGADLLVLPYNGWEDNYRPAVRTIRRLKPRKVVLDHFDDAFPPVTMPLDPGPLLERFKGRVRVMKKGEAVEV